MRPMNALGTMHAYRREVVDGVPQWTCSDCGKRAYLTEARAMGLFPPGSTAPKPQQLTLPGVKLD